MRRDVVEDFRNTMAEMEREIKELRTANELRTLNAIRRNLEGKVVKENNKYYGKFELGRIDIDICWIKMYECLDQEGYIYGEKSEYFSYWDEEVVLLDRSSVDIGDKSLKVKGLSLKDIKNYIESHGVDTKKVLHKNSNWYLDFGFEILENKELIIEIYSVDKKSECEKFSTFYNKLKKVGLDELPIKAIKFGLYTEDTLMKMSIKQDDMSIILISDTKKARV